MHHRWHGFGVVRGLRAPDGGRGICALPLSVIVRSDPHHPNSGSLCGAGGGGSLCHSQGGGGAPHWVVGQACRVVRVSTTVTRLVFGIEEWRAMPERIQNGGNRSTPGCGGQQPRPAR